MEKAAPNRRNLRREMIARRMAHDSELALRRSRLAQEFILRSPSWKKAATVALYMPIRGETDTSILLKAALATGKKLYLPKMADAKNMKFAPCLDLSSLAPGRFGIAEPAEPEDGDEPGSLDLIVAPGVAFDRRGYRLGYGLGCYDRALAEFSGPSIGLCFSFQIIEAIPNEAWDMPMSAVCTEAGWQ